MQWIIFAGFVFIFAGINIFLLAYYSATDRAGIVVTGSLLRGMVLIALYGFILSRIFGLNGVFLSFVASEITTLVVIPIMSRTGKRSLPETSN